MHQVQEDQQLKTGKTVAGVTDKHLNNYCKKVIFSEECKEDVNTDNSVLYGE